MPQLTSSRTTKGFTLIEVLVVVAIVALLTAFAMPSYSKFIANNNVREAVGDWSSSLQFARTEALRRNTSVVLCPSNDGIACSDATDDYEKGWIVAVGTAAAPGLVLRDVLPKSKLTMTVLPVANRSIVILGNGQPIGTFAGLSVTVKPTSAATTDTSMNKTVCVARTGRVRIFRQDEYTAITSAAAGACTA